MSEPFVHESSYRGRGIASFVHRSRLRSLESIFGDIPVAPASTVGDFGCSNGFILAELWEHYLQDMGCQLYGFDHEEALLVLARERGIPQSTFAQIDLNRVDRSWEEKFDLVLCLETLEHVGDQNNAVESLYVSLKKGGHLLISIPNEKGIPGLLKFFGRLILRRNAYGQFFRDKSMLRYVWYLLAGRPIDRFRSPAAKGWGPHLGFDWLRFEAHLTENYLSPGKLNLIQKRGGIFSFTKFYLLIKPS